MAGKGAGTLYSERLGRIRDAQFAAAVSRAGFGTFVRAEPTTAGLFGQNVFLTTTTGEYVLRGAPHWVPKKGNGPTEFEPNDAWQFTKEAFFARVLREQTGAPSPWPLFHDTASEIFGWPYLLMPRMPGHCFEDRTILEELSARDRHGVAEALGAMLAQMQTLRWDFAGEMDLELNLTPYPHGNTRHVIDQTAVIMRTARANGVLEDADDKWVDAAAARALAVPGTRPHTFVHGDYKLNNLTVMKATDGSWRVTGIFDLHEARFGDGASDLVRQACSYLDTEPALARVFVDAYRARVPADPALTELMPLYLLNDRMKFWGFFANPAKRAEWTKGKSFRQWAERYVDAIMNLM